jgi:hypothetical protein
MAIVIMNYIVLQNNTKRPIKNQKNITSKDKLMSVNSSLILIKILPILSLGLYLVQSTMCLM